VTAEPALAERIEKIRRLESAGLVSWVQAAELIEQVHEAWEPADVLPAAWPRSVFQLARLRLIELEGLYLLGCRERTGRQRGILRSPFDKNLIEPLQMSREQLVAAILNARSG
jgi:hypothetical protein